MAAIPDGSAKGEGFGGRSSGRVEEDRPASCGSGRMKGATLTLAQACLSVAVEHVHVIVGMARELDYANYSFSWRILCAH